MIGNATMKVFYSSLDMMSAATMPSRLQHVVIGEMAARLGGTVSFYVAEDPAFMYEQYTLRARLALSPAMDGLIFLRLQQFAYGDKIDVAFMGEILDMGYEIHFARENLSIRSRAELKDCFPTLYAFQIHEGNTGENPLYLQHTTTDA